MLRILASRVGAVMATDTVAKNVYVIERSWAPGNCGVTVIASVIAGDVCRMFSDRHDAIVTGSANTYYMRMIYREDGHKNIGSVTILADIACLNVCRILANSLDPVVTIDAIATDIHVIEVCRQPAKS